MKFTLCSSGSESVFDTKYRNQLKATVIANIIIFSHGIAVGWLSPTLTILLSPHSPLPFTVSIEEASWIGSLVGLGSVAGNIVFGALLDRVGRKMCLLALAVPHWIMWMLVMSAKSVWYLYVGRFLAGITGGGGYCVLAIYIAEIADISIRGTLASMVMLSLNCGILAGLILSAHLAYNLMPGLVILLPLIYFMLVLWLPDTPVYLLRKGDDHSDDLGEDSVRYYKNLGDVDNAAFGELVETIRKGQPASDIALSDFTNRHALKAFAISLVLLFVNQFCGAFAFVNYMSRIFDQTGSIVDANTSSIIAGAVQIVGSYTATCFVDRYGRKILLLISTGGMFASLLLTSLYTHYAATVPALAAHNWIPFVLMQYYIFIANIGVVSLTIVVLVETMPIKLRSLGTSVGMVVLSTMVFAMLKIFPIYLHNFGITATMLSCAAVSLFGFFNLLFFLEETKDKSMITDEQHSC